MEGEKEKELEEKEKELNQDNQSDTVSEEEKTEEKSLPGEEGETEENVKVAEKSEVEKLKEELKTYEAQLKEYHDRWLRAVAEFENFRKRTEREKEKFFEYALENFFKEFLPILDAFEKGIEAVEKNSDQKDQLIEGVKLIYRNILSVLEKFGVRQIEALGRQFDPFYHEAVSRVTSGDHEPGTVVEEFQKGYMLKDRVIRPAMVAVAVGSEEAQAETVQNLANEESEDVSDKGESEIREDSDTSREEKIDSDEGEEEGEVPVEIIDEGSE